MLTLSIVGWDELGAVRTDMPQVWEDLPLAYVIRPFKDMDRP